MRATAKPSRHPGPGKIYRRVRLCNRGPGELASGERIAALTGDSATAQGIGKALAAIEESLDQILGLYKAIAGIWRGQQAVSVDPASLRPPPQQIELHLLAVEQVHLKTIARIFNLTNSFAIPAIAFKE